jgi:hypothetical protein
VWRLAARKATPMNRTQRAISWLQSNAPLLSGFLRQLKGYDNQLISLEYRVDNHKPRYGYSQPKLASIDAICSSKRFEIRRQVESFVKFVPALSGITLASSESATDPYWESGWFPVLDAISLYGFLRDLAPKTYLEVGSGHSTRFARRAVTDGALPTKILSIDPHPRANISKLSDSITRSRLQDTDLSVFDQLESGDVVLFDGSHRSFVNTDVTVFFLEVLPRLSRGVLVAVHDVYLPFDYPPGIPFYNEQYLLGAYMAAGTKLELVLPNAYVTRDPELRLPLEAAVKQSLVPGAKLAGCAFWVRTN